MTRTEILKCLCWYDERNPTGGIETNTAEELRALKKNNCKCDNCFYGRTELAEYILSIEDSNVIKKENI